jgi:hypothetical protein
MPPEPSDYQERPQICGRIYNTKEKCIEQQAHVDEMFLPKCAPLKTNGTQTSASRIGSSRLHHPVIAAGHSAGSIDDMEVFTLSTGAYFLWCSSHDLNQCNRIYASRDRCIEEFMTAPANDARCLPLKFDAPAFQPKSHQHHPESPPGHGTAPSRASLPSISCSSTARICADQDHIPAKEQERIPATAEPDPSRIPATSITIVSPDLLAKPPPRLDSIIAPAPQRRNRR